MRDNLKGGWNRSSGDLNASKTKSPFKMRGIIIGVLTVFVACLAVWMTLNSSSQSVESVDSAARSKEIAEHRPSIKTNKHAAVVALDEKKGPPPNVKKDARGVWRYPSGVRWLDPNRKVDVIDNTPHVAKIFKHAVERQIAGLLQTEPGAMVFGTTLYPDSLRQDFANSLVDKIEINKDDTPEDIDLKRAVEATKKEIAQRIRNGEDLIEILKSSREELARLGAYRNDLQAEINRVVKDENFTDDDVKDFEEAANMMLEKEGLPKIKAPNLIIRQHLLMREKERKAEEARKSTTETNK